MTLRVKNDAPSIETDGIIEERKTGNESAANDAGSRPRKGPWTHGYTTAYRILGNAEDAEDAYQDVFLKIVSGWTGRLKPKGVRDWGAFSPGHGGSARRRPLAAQPEPESWKGCPDAGNAVRGRTVRFASGSPEPSNPRQAAIQSAARRTSREAVRSLPQGKPSLRHAPLRGLPLRTDRGAPGHE